MAKHETTINLTGMAGLRPGEQPPPLGDPRELDDAELVRRLALLAYRACMKSPRRVHGRRIDLESLYSRVLAEMFRLARAYVPDRGSTLVNMLLASTRFCWQQEASDARVFGPKGCGDVYTREVGRHGHWEPADPDAADWAISSLADRSAGEPDGCGSPAAEFAAEDRETDYAIGLILSSLPTRRSNGKVVRKDLMARAARICLAEGRSCREAAVELGVSEHAVRDWLDRIRAVARRRPTVRELAGLPAEAEPAVAAA